MAVQKVVLTTEQMAVINEALEVANQLLTDMDSAERCGIDCQKRRVKLQQAVNQLNAIREEFSTWKPSKRSTIELQESTK